MTASFNIDLALILESLRRIECLLTTIAKNTSSREPIIQGPHSPGFAGLPEHHQASSLAKRHVQLRKDDPGQRFTVFEDGTGFFVAEHVGLGLILASDRYHFRADAKAEADDKNAGAERVP